jgi:hypothetical protein
LDRLTLFDGHLRGGDRAADATDGGQYGALGNSRIQVVGLLEQLHFCEATLQRFNVQAGRNDQDDVCLPLVEEILRLFAREHIRSNCCGSL